MEKQTVLRFCKRLKPSGGAGRAAAVQATKCPPDRTLPPFRQMQTAPAAPHAPSPRPPTARATVRRLTHRQPTAVADPRLQTEKGPIPVRRGSIAGGKDRIQPVSCPKGTQAMGYGQEIPAYSVRSREIPAESRLRILKTVCFFGLRLRYLSEPSDYERRSGHIDFAAAGPEGESLLAAA